MKAIATAKLYRYLEVKRIVFLISIMLGLVLGQVQPASAHGVDMSYESKSVIDVAAQYDNGEPMSEAQVSIFSPDNPAEPWETGVMDQKGHYMFTPDPGKPGTWDVQVRKAGHGAMIHIAVGGEENADASAPDTASTGFGMEQKAVMAACVIWGLVGTGLYFRRRKN